MSKISFYKVASLVVASELKRAGFSEYRDYSGMSYSRPLQGPYFFGVHPGLHGRRDYTFNPYIGLIHEEVESLLCELTETTSFGGPHGNFTVSMQVTLNIGLTIADRYNEKNDVLRADDDKDVLLAKTRDFVKIIEEKQSDFGWHEEGLERLLQEVNNNKAYRIPIILSMQGKVDDALKYLESAAATPLRFGLSGNRYDKFIANFKRRIAQK